MKILSLICLSCFLCILTEAFAQSQPIKSPAKPPIAERPRWEYLVVSLPKVRFSDPLTTETTKIVGLPNLIRRGMISEIATKEDVTSQHYLDVLGISGWELIGIVGAIGADREMVFKRAYLPERSKLETELIIKERETLNPPLVDLDEVERISLITEIRKNEETRLQKAIESLNYPGLTTKNIASKASSATDSDVSASVEVDRTKELLSDGNKYSSSAADKVAEEIANRIFGAAGLRPKYAGESPRSGSFTSEVRVWVEVVVVFNGKHLRVGSYGVGGNWPERVKP